MIKILITGDFCPHKRIEQLVENRKYSEIYNDFLPYLENNDLNITNLECPLLNEKSPISKIGSNLFAKEACIKALKFGGFNLLSLSNNHILDHGERGLSSTIELCRKNNIEYLGAGKNLEEASQILVKEIENKRIAFLNFSENEFSTAEIEKAGSNPLDPIKNYYSIKSARSQADYVFVIIHGGHEGYSLPSPRMVDTYRFFIDAGADIVVGHHPHCYSGFENYNHGNIFYSLGNFIFDWEGYRASDWNYGYAVRFLLDDKQISFEIIPYKQCDLNPGVHLLSDPEKEKFEIKLKQYFDILQDNNLLKENWNIFLKKVRKYYIISFESFNSKIYKALRYSSLLPGILSKKKKMDLLNLIRCESHRDVAIESLKLKSE